MNKLAFLFFVVSVITSGSIAQGHAADEIVIQEANANGGRNLRPFKVQDNWEIRWSLKGDLIQIYVHPQQVASDDVLASLPTLGANQQGPGDGASYQPKGGTYYLEINAIGDWSVTEVQLP